MAKRGRPRKGMAPLGIKEQRVGLYITPAQRARLNWLVRHVGADSQDEALAAALDAVGVPAEIPADQPAPVSA